MVDVIMNQTTVLPCRTATLSTISASCFTLRVNTPSPRGAVLTDRLFFVYGFPVIEERRNTSRSTTRNKFLSLVSTAPFTECEIGSVLR